MNKRRDNRGRLLHNGEFQMAGGRYRYKYQDSFGRERAVYSLRLVNNDPTPPGKKRTLSLREMERQIQADIFDHIVSNGGNYTVLELSTKIAVRQTTSKGYGTVINILKKESVRIPAR